MKTCNKCRESKDDSEFHKHKKTKDGLQPTCKECQRAIHKAYAAANRERLNEKRREYNAVNKDKVKEVNRKQYEKNSEAQIMRQKEKLLDPEFREKKKAYLREYYTANREFLLLQKRKFYEEHVELIRQRYRNWRQTERGRTWQRLYGSKKREERKALDWQYSIDDYEYTFRLFEGKCFNCWSRHNLHVDHHMPLSKGFGLSRTNAVILCGKCNSKKRNRLPENFYSPQKLTMLKALLGI